MQILRKNLFEALRKSETRENSHRGEAPYL
nr:unnamed protein product [Callosobruchus chinensis]